MPYAIKLKNSKKKELGVKGKLVWVNQDIKHWYVEEAQRTLWNTKDEIPPKLVNSPWEEIVEIEGDLA